MPRSLVLARVTTHAMFVCVSAMLASSCAFSTDSDGLEPEETEATSDELIIVGDEDDPPLNRCLTDAHGSFTPSAFLVPLGQSFTMRWTATLPSGCTAARYYFESNLTGSTLVSATGSRVIAPQATATYRLRLYITGYGERVLAYSTVAVDLPDRVDVTSNNHGPMFLQAVQEGNHTVVVANNVQLDLTGKHDINFGPNTMLQGGRGGLQPGPRIFTTTRFPVFFYIGSFAVNVRITGLRIEGPDLGSDERYGNRGILIDSGVNTEIDHNEIYGWTLAAIHVRDMENNAVSQSPVDTGFVPTHTVNIHDNYIHNNQAVGGDGYGVASGYGAHPLIIRNVFDWNRHAIEGDGKEGTGYTAVHNLVLEHGGLHRWNPFTASWIHTHQFDMHGLNDCGIADIWSDSLANCGPAGHTMLIRHNAFYYGEDHAIKLRGTPAVGMFVGQNVFAAHIFFGHATHQNESGLVEEPGNQYAFNGMAQLGSCDFDGDGTNDSFLATGENWWMRSAAIGPWEFLNASKKKRSEVILGFFNNDNRCDVRADGIIFPGGKPATFPGPVIGGGVATGP